MLNDIFTPLQTCLTGPDWVHASLHAAMCRNIADVVGNKMPIMLGLDICQEIQCQRMVRLLFGI